MLSPTKQDLTKFRRIGQGFCGSVWAAEGGNIAMKREDGGPGRSLLNDYNIHQLILQKLTSQTSPVVSVCIPRWPDYVTNNNSTWWDTHLSRFPTGYTSCNVLCAERIPLLPKEVRHRLIDRYCPPSSRATIKSNDADRDCLVRPYLGRRKIQNEVRKCGRHFFSLRNYPLHLNQAEELNLPVSEYARAMAEILAVMHWRAKIDANDIEFVLGGVPTHPQPQPQSQTADHEYTHPILGTHSLWVLDFDCCTPLPQPMDSTGIDQAAHAFLRNDPYFPRPALSTQSSSTTSSEETLWREFSTRYLTVSRDLISGGGGGGRGQHGGTNVSSLLLLPAKFIARVVEMHGEQKAQRT